MSQRPAARRESDSDHESQVRTIVPINPTLISSSSVYDILARFNGGCSEEQLGLRVSLLEILLDFDRSTGKPKPRESLCATLRHEGSLVCVREVYRQTCEILIDAMHADQLTEEQRNSCMFMQLEQNPIAPEAFV